MVGMSRMKNPFTNPFRQRTPLLAGIASDMLPVTTSDTDNLPAIAMGLYVETGGTLSFISASGNARSITVPDSYVLSCGVIRVNATGIAASGIHAYVLD